MKLRILDDHVRLRLDRDEVARLGAGGSVGAMTRFPGGAVLGCLVRVQGRAVAARFDGGRITIDVPFALAQAWAADDREVAMAEEIPHGDHVLSVLIEKDFECLEPRAGEDQSNRFPNPKAPVERR